MDDFEGIIIEESLTDKEILNKVEIVSTKVKKVTEEERTPWIKQWTMHTVRINEEEARGFAEELKKHLDYSHGTSWYADFRNNRYHYIVFRDKVFFIDRHGRAQYEEAQKYGIALGIPQYQVDFDLFFIKNEHF